MPTRLYIPAQVIDSIAEHIQHAVASTAADFFSAAESEDTMTGHLGARLTVKTKTVEVTQDDVNGPWKWSLQYRKFRSQGASATERHLGADGLFELLLDRGYRQDTKTLLFQAKLDWRTSKDVLEQSMKMSTWREAAIVINYTPQDVYAYSVDSALSSRGVESDAKGRISLATALSEHFLQCKIGDVDLHYDPQARRLLWRDNKGVWVAVEFTVPHRFRVHVMPPSSNQVRVRRYDKLIESSEIHLHRMQASPEDVLMPLLSATTDSPKARKRSLAALYHPDKYSEFDSMIQALATKRMQEINEALNAAVKRGGEDA